MAMDRPEIIEKLIVVDCLPILEHLERADWKFARDWYHWFFFAQPEKPERAILADPVAWYGLTADVMGSDAYDDMLRAIRNPKVVHGMVEDYRAGVRIDHHHDREDRDAGKKVQCPTLCLWSSATTWSRYTATRWPSGGTGQPMCKGSESTAAITLRKKTPKPWPRQSSPFCSERFRPKKPNMVGYGVRSSDMFPTGGDGIGRSGRHLLG